MKFRFTRGVTVVLLGVVFLIYANRPRAIAQVPDPRYFVSSVTLSGPGSLTPGTNSDYTVTITVARNNAALNVGVDGTVELRDGGTLLAFKTFTVLRNQNTTTLKVGPLLCSGGNVSGAATLKPDGSTNNPNSGRSTISLTAHVNETDSSAMTVMCGGAKPWC